MLVTYEPDEPAVLSLTGMERGSEVRAAGAWFEKEALKGLSGEEPGASDTLPTISRHVANSVICSGIDPGKWASLMVKGRHAMSPEAYQIMPMDLMHDNWMGSLGISDFPRTRLLIADEGGVGKTLSASLMVADKYKQDRGVILILCPPSVVWKWVKELRFCLMDMHREVRRSYAGRLNSNIPDGIYVISKWSVEKRWEHDPQPDWIPETSMVVIDEIHQGTAANLGGPLWMSQKAVCDKAETVVSTTASPLQRGYQDLLKIYEMMGGECADSVGGIRAMFQQPNCDQEFADWNSVLVKGMDLVEGAPNDIDLWVADALVRLPDVLSWMDPADRQLVIDEFQSNARQIMIDNERGAANRLLRELHPFGRFFSIVRRAEIPGAADIFRDRTDEFHRIELCLDHQNALTNLTGEKRIRCASWAPEAGISADDDPRWNKTIEIIEQEIGQSGSGTCRGVVIFVDRLVTLEGMKKELKDKYQGSSEVMIGDIQGSTENNEGANEAFRRKSREGGFPVVICTSAAEVGMDMEWATACIMWDIDRNPETLSQRTWRLDRRKDMPNATGQFRIIHTQNQENQTKIDEMNNRHDLSTSILGRQGGQFIPPAQTDSPVVVSRTWATNGGVFAITTEEGAELASRVGLTSNNQSDLFQKDLEKIFWMWISELTHLPVNLEVLDRGFVELVGGSSNLKSRSIAWELSNLCTKSEMATLWKLIANPIDTNNTHAASHRFSLRFHSPPQHNHGACSIQREGQLSTNLRKITLDSVDQQDLLSFGPGSRYLCWIPGTHYSEGQHSVLVNRKWLEIWVDNRNLMYLLKAKSPLMIHTEENYAIFLENHPSHKEVLYDVLDLSSERFEPNKGKLGLYLGEDDRDEDAPWPILSQQATASMEDVMDSEKQRLLDEVTNQLIAGRIKHEDADKYHQTISNFEFESHDVIPLFFLEED